MSVRLIHQLLVRDEAVCTGGAYKRSNADNETGRLVVAEDSLKMVFRRVETLPS